MYKHLTDKQIRDICRNGMFGSTDYDCFRCSSNCEDEELLEDGSIQYLCSCCAIQKTRVLLQSGVKIYDLPEVKRYKEEQKEKRAKYYKEYEENHKEERQAYRREYYKRKKK